ncbi:MAG: ribonuclease Z [Paenibacillus sp. RIFOXYA1_FULL_44_5]|nr:MAG: ribonuclease Z [Paenibacillus sp. RIFOXYA1_FULL_44_5]
MNLYFLGTGAGMPSKRRNVTSIVLRLLEERGTLWMFDCGEGTQHQILHSPVRLSRLEKVFITHLHGDHLYGLPGLLTSRAHTGGETPVTVYGPLGIEQYIKTVLELSQGRLTYELKIVEIQEGTIFQDEQFTVEALKLEHRIDSYGYRITEADRHGRLNAEALKERGIRPGPVYGTLKEGNDVVLPDGTTLFAADFLADPIKGKVVAILGDTRVCAHAEMLAQQADVLVHEATFSHELQELAYKYGHSTAVEAAETAKRANAKQLIVTHISSRYDDGHGDPLLKEAQEIFPDVQMAKDFLDYPIV